MPDVFVFGLWGAEFLVEVGPVFEGCPVDGFGVPGAEVGFGVFEDEFVGELIGEADALVGVLDHPEDGGEDGAGDLEGGGVLAWVGDESAGFVDIEE